MKVQLVNLSGKNTNNYKVTEVNSFSNLYSPDMFDLNIIDLKDREIWKNYKSSKVFNSVELINDFNSIRNMVIESRKTKFLFLIPRNVMFYTQYISHNKKHYTKLPIKDILPTFSKLLMEIIPENIDTLYYEKTRTTINNKQLQADFYFNEYYIPKDWKRIKSDGSEKITAYSYKNYTITGLDILNNEEMQFFCKKFNLLSQPGMLSPEWFKDIELFDDSNQKGIIDENIERIKFSEGNIERAKEKLTANNEYKSILYTSGDELADVVVKILEEILEVNLDGFIDEKKEDFLLKIDKMRFIGEVKGVNNNVKSSNLSQLDHHYLEYIEDNEISVEDVGDIFKLLIMNHQKSKAPNEREPVHQNQINDAKNKYSSLIIETPELLKLLEKKINSEITKDECIELLKKTGILKLN